MDPACFSELLSAHVEAHCHVQWGTVQWQAWLRSLGGVLSLQFGCLYSLPEPLLGISTGWVLTLPPSVAVICAKTNINRAAGMSWSMIPTPSGPCRLSVPGTSREFPLLGLSCRDTLTRTTSDVPSGCSGSTGEGLVLFQRRKKNKCGFCYSLIISVLLTLEYIQSPFHWAQEEVGMHWLVWAKLRFKSNLACLKSAHLPIP